MFLCVSDSEKFRVTVFHAWPNSLPRPLVDFIGHVWKITKSYCTFYILYILKVLVFLHHGLEGDIPAGQTSRILNRLLQQYSTGREEMVLNLSKRSGHRNHGNGRQCTCYAPSVLSLSGRNTCLILPALLRRDQFARSAVLSGHFIDFLCILFTILWWTPKSSFVVVIRLFLYFFPLQTKFSATGLSHLQAWKDVWTMEKDKRHHSPSDLSEMVNSVLLLVAICQNVNRWEESSDNSPSASVTCWSIHFSSVLLDLE